MARRHWLRWFRRRLRESIRDNSWLLPAIGGLAGLLLSRAIGAGDASDTRGWTITVDRSRDTLFGMLALLFTALSIVLALASVAAQNVVGRFGSRTLRLYLRRSVERYVIGAFALTAAFIMSEQFQLRKLEPDSPAPVAGLTMSIVLLVVTAGFMITYIGAVVRWFRVDRAAIVLRRSVLEAARAVARAGRTTCSSTRLPPRPAYAGDILAPNSGYLAEIDADTLLDACRPLHATVVITESVGATVIEGQPMGWIAGGDSRIVSIPAEHVADTIDVRGTRELATNLEYGIIAMVDIANIALSPAVNNPNTAAEVIEEMGVMFREIDPSVLGPYVVSDDATDSRVIVDARSFGRLVQLATTQIVEYGTGDAMVRRSLGRLARSLQLRDLTESDRRYVDDFAARVADAVDDDADSG